MYTNIIAAIKATPSVPKPSLWFSIFPPQIQLTPAGFFTFCILASHSEAMAPVVLPTTCACTVTEGDRSYLSKRAGPDPKLMSANCDNCTFCPSALMKAIFLTSLILVQIGRASCREREYV